MTLDSLQQSFLKIFQRAEEQNVSLDFLGWIEEKFLAKRQKEEGQIGKSNTCSLSTHCSEDASVERNLQKISGDIRALVPLDAILAGEVVKHPDYGEFSEIDPQHTSHVDAFLYDDSMVDELADEGKLAMNYCTDCGSHNTKPTTIISHSMSMEKLYYVFRSLLPPVPENAVVVDVGSRLGAVLYGAYFYTKCKNLIGIEIDPKWCEIQKKMITKHNLKDRIRIISGDIQHNLDILQKADIVILHNVFEFFLSKDLQSGIWQLMKSALKKGTQIVSLPPLHEALEFIEVDFALDEWVTEMPRHYPNIAAPYNFEDEVVQLKRYQVR